MTDRVAARDGSVRLVRHWPTPGVPWAHLLLVHGLGEHSGRYEHVGDWLADAGIECHAIDLRGFGGSDGPRGDIDRWEHFHEDVEDAVMRIRDRAGGSPVVVYGHSLGGLVALGHALSRRMPPDLLVLSTPGLDVTLPAWKRALVTVAGRLAPSQRIANGISGEMLSRDPAVGRAYVGDPLNVHRSTIRLARLGLAEQLRVRAEVASLDLPTYVFHGGDDRLVPPAASLPLEGRPGVDRVVLPGLRHETHNEPEGEAVIGLVVDWLRSRVVSVGQPAGD